MINVNANIPLNVKTCVHTWQIGALYDRTFKKLHSEKKISLFRKNDHLKCETLDVEKNKTTSRPIPIPEGFDIQAMINYLARCVIVDLDREDAPTFKLPQYQWTLDKYIVKLLYFKKNLIWELFNEKFPTSFRIPYGPETMALDCKKCSLHMLNLLNKIGNNLADEHRVANYLENFTITRIEKSALNTPLRLHLSPLNKKSFIDKRVRLSKLRWSVGMFADGNGKKGNHAVLIIEGLDENGAYFMHKVHFNGQIVKSKTINPTDFKYDERTELWVVDSNDVKSMLKSFEIENELGIVPPFEITGFNSILGRGNHNCCTWAREKLKVFLNINLPNSPLGFLITITKYYTKKPDYYGGKQVTKYL